jgi:hypothetical protein
MALAAAAAVVLGTRHGYNDFRVFRDAASAVLADRSPYPAPHSWAVRHNAAFVYPLPAAWAFTPFALLPFATSADAYLALSILAVVAGLWLLRVTDPLVHGFVLLSSSCLHGLQLGTVNAFLFLALAAMWRFRRRAGALGAAAGAAIALKLFLAPMLVYVATRSWRGLGIAAAVPAALLAASLLGGFHLLGYLGLLEALSRQESLRSMSLAATLKLLEVSRGVAWDVAVGVSAALLAIAVAGHRKGADERLVFATCVVAALAATPIAWNHYAVLLFVPTMLVARRRLAVGAVFAASELIAGVRFGAVDAHQLRRYFLQPYGPKVVMQVVPVAILLALYGWWLRARAQPRV